MRILCLHRILRDIIERYQEDLRKVVSTARSFGHPGQAMSSAIAYFDSYRSENLPANLLQAQRDYFGAHMFERTDKPRGEFFHFNWTEHGGRTSASAYTV